MKRIKSPKIACMICFLSIPMILFMFFFLPNLVSKHYNLFFTTYEFIVVAKSSRAAVFVMFIVIVVTIFLGSPKSSAATELERFYHPCPSVYYEMDGVKESEYNNDEDYDNYDDDDDDDYEYHGYDGRDEDNDDDLDTEDVDSEDETGVDLGKKIDEFIAKVYKKWREEIRAERLICPEPPS